jgi:H+-translocating NAD(P) transhydrogenase subunit alpha
VRIGIPRESRPGENRVAGTPTTVPDLVALGHHVLVEATAGARASFPDGAYAGAGVELVGPDEVWAGDVVIKVRPPEPAEVARLRPGATLVGLLAPAQSPELLRSLAARGVTALAMDAVPRVSRAQSLDVLSSMANIGGYRAVIEAAHEFGRLFTGQVTAAGNIAPARVFVVGAGVAGLAAIGTATSLGAVVRAFDVRPEVAEQVASMGARFVHLEGPGQGSQRADGYASEMSADLERQAMALYARECADADIVITTALIPGRPAPRLVTAETVAAMRAGSVIVDMAAANGGNCELTRPDEVVTSDNGVRIVGYTDLPGRLPAQASQLYGTNVVNLLRLLTPEGAGELRLDLDDEVQRAITVVHGGEVTWPPPPVSVSAGSPGPVPAPPPRPEAAQRPPADPRRAYAAMGLAAVVFALVATVSPASFLGHFTVFALAVIVGYYVISNVTHALHTPLMAETNAISGIILVGAILQVGNEDPLVRSLAVAATVVASVNVFGGFAVTGRMLKMFRKS